VFGPLATALGATVSLKELRTQIEKMKKQVEAEYLALVNEKDILAPCNIERATIQSRGGLNLCPFSLDHYTRKRLSDLLDIIPGNSIMTIFLLHAGDGLKSGFLILKGGFELHDHVFTIRGAR
jgi:hypothetical protein